MDIIDFHVHLPVDGFDEQFVRYYRRFDAAYGPEKLKTILGWGEADDRRWREAWRFPEPDPPLPPGEAAKRWHDEAARHGLAGVVCVTGGGNRALAEAIAPYRDIFSGFAHHHPAAEGAAAALKTAVRDYGLKGYKIFAPLVEQPLAGASFEPLWRIAEAHRLPVLVHFGILGGGGGIASGVNISSLGDR